MCTYQAFFFYFDIFCRHKLFKQREGLSHRG
jgi:hypothetical protein